VHALDVSIALSKRKASKILLFSFSSFKAKLLLRK
jgi:hypothetical protein